MWILSLEWLLLAVLVFWVVGAVKRLKRLRLQSKQAFVSVDTQCVQMSDWLRHCARLQALKDKVAGVSLDLAPDDWLSSADALEKVLLQARSHPLHAQSIVDVEHACHTAQTAWQTHLQRATGLSGVQDEQFQEWSQRWEQLTILHLHSTEQFNAVVRAYNRAIAQFPACVIARLSGFQPIRIFQKDAASQMQSNA